MTTIRDLLPDHTVRDDAEGAELLDDLAAALARYVAFPSISALHAVTLWVAHTHAVLAFESTPRLALLSPEKGSGKTRTLEVLNEVVPNAMHAVNLSAAALFRQVAAKQPTLLFDECDTYFGPKAKEHEELRGLLNAGHRKGAVAYRCVGEPAKMQVCEFPAYAAVALAGIGDLPDTILDRSVVIRMKRRAPDELIEPFRHRTATPYLRGLCADLSGWAERVFDDLARAEPTMPMGLVDRPADVWEPLLAVADAAGGRWPMCAREAAMEINRARAESDPSLGVQLLRDVRRAFDDAGRDRLFTEDLIERLCAFEESPWGDLRGRPIDARGVARFVGRFGVRSKQVRVGETTKKGYAAEDFADAFARYLPVVLQRNTETSETTDTGLDGVPSVSDVPLFRQTETQP